MAKPKSPLLSLGARGTIGDALTYQKRNQDTIAQKKPIPKDPYSLAQAYQRWDYRDYAYLWTLETEASKQTYRTRASRYHITGYSLWMREHLRDLPDLAGRWHLDNIVSSKALDSSKNANHLTVYGATPIDGIIDKALYFDGLDDKLSHPTLWDIMPTEFTIMAFIYLAPGATAGRIINKSPLGNNEFQLRARSATGQVDFNTLIDGVWIYLRSTDSISPNTWYLVTAIYKAGEKSKLYLNATEDIAATAAGTLPSGTLKDFTIGARYDGYQSFEGRIDEPKLYTRALDITEIKRHSERSYPP